MNSYITPSSPAGDFETVTVSTVSIGGTAAKLLINQAGGGHKRAIRAFITIESAAIRVRYDGTAPTAAVGHALNAGDSLTVDGEGNVANLRMIRSGAVDASASVTYFYNY